MDYRVSKDQKVIAAFQAHPEKEAMMVYQEYQDHQELR